MEYREGGFDPWSSVARLGPHGLPDDARAQLLATRDRFGSLRPGLPERFTGVTEGEILQAGRYSWRVIFGHGHAPEHVCLYCQEEGVLIPGDMVLPHISPHVGSPTTWTQGNPVALFQESLSRLAGLPPDTLVLPSHGTPFVGLRERVLELEVHHRGRCRLIWEALEKPRCAGDLLEVLFTPGLDLLQVVLAMNETMAHLAYLEERGDVDSLAGEDGITRYVRRFDRYPKGG
jgi:glyoxylase-like metal-dependent hydrolase (beta-lactamase superfamily II)